MDALNLTKGQTVDLKKADGTAVSKIRVGLSWDVSEGKTMDLDLFVVGKVAGNTTVAFFNAKNAIKGIQLGEDNVTGAGDGDDEFVNMDATQSEDGEYSIAVNIYDAASKAQTFADVKNAKATVYNQETNEVLATYSITENGGANTGLIVGKVIDAGNAYSFTAMGNFVMGDINAIAASL